MDYDDWKKRYDDLLRRDKDSPNWAIEWTKIYSEYIGSSIWRDKRQERLEIDNFECRTCGEKENLQVHHKPDAYQRLSEESVEDDLTTLCEICHDAITNRIRKKRYKNKEHFIAIEEKKSHKPPEIENPKPKTFDELLQLTETKK